MKIAIDIRTKENSKFIERFINNLLAADKKNNYNIYISNKDLNNYDKNINIIKNKSIPGSFSDQYFFKKELKKEKYDLVIFFSHKNPIFYKGNTILILDSLVELSYHSDETNNSINKFVYNFLLKKSLKKSKKILTFTKKIKTELNEKLNIIEDKISIIPPYFIENKLEKESEINIKSKLSIKGKYLIYSGDKGPNKNLDRLVETIKYINKKEDLDLIFLGSHLCNDIEIRNTVVRHNISKNIHFVSNVTKNDISDYYRQSNGVIFPSLYEGFPFDLNEAINTKTQIIASKISIIKDIFEGDIVYFNPTSKKNMRESIIAFIKDKKMVSYKHIRDKYSINKTIEKFLITINNLNKND